MSNTVIDLYRQVKKLLEDAGVPHSETDARLLLEEALSVELTRAYAGMAGEPSSEQLERLNRMAERRKDGEPLQYILGSWDFLGYSFFVGKGVLVPRSETEVLTEYALNRLKGYKNPVVYDLCSGSGCIGLSIKKLCPEAHVYLIEKSTEALFWLKKNVSRLGLEGEVNVIKGDILTDCFTELPPPDVIISNPPYIESGLLPSLQREVQMEPSLALDGGTDGLDFYRCLCENWFKRINRGGFMALECGEEQSGRIASLFPALTDVEVFCDYCGVDRFLAASCRAGSSPIAAAHEPPHTQATANRK